MLAVVLSFDVFPLRLLGCYGSTAETVCLNKIAAEAVVFDQHFGEDFSSSVSGRTFAPGPAGSGKSGKPAASAVPLTEDGHAWWTGCYHFPRKGTSLLAEVKSLPELLAKAGVESQWVMTTGPLPLPTGAEATEVNSFAALVGKASEVLDDWKETERSRLLWLKAGGLAWELAKLPDLFTEEELEFLSDEAKSREVYRELMTSAIERCDEELEPLWDKLREAGKQQPVLFLITAGRGLSLGERTDSEDSPATWAEEFVHLPLLVWHSQHAGGDRRSELTQSMDIPATLLDFLAIPPPKSCEGRSLLPIFRGEDLPWRNTLTYGCFGSWGAIRTRDYHFIRRKSPAEPNDDGRMLFIKPDDVWDWHNVSNQEPELTETLSRQLDAFLKSAASQLPVPDPIPEDESGPNAL